MRVEGLGYSVCARSTGEADRSCAEVGCRCCAADGTVSSCQSQACLGTTVKLQFVPDKKLTDSVLKLQQHHTL